MCFARIKYFKIKVVSVVMITMMLQSVTAIPVLKAASTVTYTGLAAPPEHKLSMWYRQPASDWQSQALPIGNGYIGGMVFGGVDQERIQFNEKTLWTGGPRSSASYSFGNRDGAASHLASVRSKLDSDDISGAGTEANTYLTGDQTGFGDYQNFGDMYFDFKLPSSTTINNYRRELDLQDGIAKVSYTYDGVDYLREYFVSYPDKVMVMRLSASQNGKISLDVRPTSAQGGAITVSGDTITTRGSVRDNQMLYESQVKVLNEGGAITPGTGKITVAGADSLTIVLAAGTDYINSYPIYKGVDPHNQVTSTIQAASSKSYDLLKSNHLNDYQDLFNRVTLNLGESTPQIPTDQLISGYGTTKDKALEVLFYQYGRYLLIASSRAGSLPANLQGIWNNSNTPPWDSDYHFNINVQMNYWPAEVANLDETMVPLIDYVESLLSPGRVSAEKHYGVTGGGWTVNTMNNPFGFTAPGWDFYWGWAPSANAFIANNVWDYYKFSGDTTKLNRIYPILKEASQFWTKYLVVDSDGTLVSSPCYSPEQGDISKGCAFDQQLVWDLFTNTIEASKTLGIDESFRSDLIAKRDMLSPVKVGRYGQIQEWKQDIDDPNNTHRHISQLVGLFPGKQINKKTPQWLDAAIVTLLHRGDDGGYGWALANKMNLWARALEGTQAHTFLEGQLSKYVFSNLFNIGGPFQIDGNFGAISGISEMLLQSHLDNIDILPALPSSWTTGSFSGLKARGGFEVGVSWTQSRATNIQIKSNAGVTAVVNYSNINGAAVVDQNGASVTYTAVGNDQIEFDTRAGSTYTISSIRPMDNKVKSILAPAAITGVAIGTAKTAEALGLPSKVKMFTYGGMLDANVSWEMNGISYDPAAVTGQTFTVTGTVILPDGVKNPNNVSLTTSVRVTVNTIPKSQMKATATSEETNSGNDRASNAIDGNTQTMWHTKWDKSDVLPQSITLNLGGSYPISQVAYLPRQSGPNGIITGYNVFVSADGVTFTKVASGNWVGDNAVKYATFASIDAAYVKLEATAGVNGWASAAEINVLVDTTSGPQAVITGSDNVSPGQTFDLTMRLRSVTQSVYQRMYAQDVTLHYDKANLRFDAVSSLKDGFQVIDQKETVPGHIRIVSANVGANEGVPTQEDMLKFKFTVKSDIQATQLSVSVGNIVIANGEGNELQVGGSSHELQISVSVDKTRLNAAITAAQTKYDAAMEGNEHGLYVIGSKAKLQLAIDAARAVANDPNAVQKQVDSAKAALEAAIQTFESNRISADINGKDGVTVGDLAIVAATYGTQEGQPGWNAKADVNHDGKIDIEDLAIVAKAILR